MPWASQAGKPDLQTAYADCRRVARRCAGNFFWSFLILPRPQRQAMYALYTFLRFTDDLGDSDRPFDDRNRDLNAWRARLDAVLDLPQFDSSPSRDELWWLALADTVARYQIPREYLHAVIDGVVSDLGAVSMDWFTDLYHYCYQVASAVGLACIRIWQVTDRAADLPAEWMGIAFQLTNILRDLVEDQRRGRIYLPREDLRRFGVDDSALLSGRSSAGFERLLQFEIARAHDYYERGEALLAYLPPPGRAVMQALAATYRALLRQIERAPAEVLRRRVSLGTPRKLWFVLRALPTRFLAHNVEQ